MKKTTLVKLLALLMLLFVSVGSTLAYLTDVEQEVNVMTLGRVEIDLIEQERNAAGTLTDFQDHHPLYPGYYPSGLNSFDKDGYWVNVQNAVDKVVTVKNTGKAPAYVRLWFAFEMTDDDKFFNKIHLNRNTTDWQWEFMYDKTTGNFDFLTQDGSRYVVAIATYNQVLAPNATTPVSLRQVLLDSSATNDDFEKLGDKYSIFVVAQGMQTVGFDSAVEALAEGFGVPSAVNHPFVGMTEADTTIPNENIPSDALVISTAKELFAFAEAINDYAWFIDKTVVLGADIDLENKAWTPIMLGENFSGVFDGLGYTIKNVNVTDCYSGGLFEYVRADFENQVVIRNVNIAGITISGSSSCAALIGQCYGNVKIHNCHVTNARIDVSYISQDYDSSNYGRFAGALIGYIENGVIVEGCSVADSYVSADQEAGQLVGSSFASQIINCSATNVQVSWNKSSNREEAGTFISNTLVASEHRTVEYEMYEHWSHTVVCAECRIAGLPTYHATTCDSRDSCAFCNTHHIYLGGGGGDEDSLNIMHSYAFAYSTTTEHVYECTTCKDQQTTYHYAPCNRADYGVCYVCNKQNVTIASLQHSYEYVRYNEVYHKYACVNCGEVGSVSRHYVECSDMDSCISCGATNISAASVGHSYICGKITANTHTLLCEVCGLEEHTSEHYAYCDDSTVCAGCGVRNLSIQEVYHYNSYSIAKYTDKDTHTFCCSECGTVTGTGKHANYCHEGNTCSYCNASGVIIDRTLHDSEIKSFDTIYHAWQCRYCSTVEYNWEHSSSCLGSASSTCTTCNAKGVVISNIYHDMSYTYATKDTHNYVCSDCGYIESTSQHYGYCVDDDFCTRCYTEGVALNSLDHHESYKYETNETHVYSCDDCGEISFTSEHNASCTAGNTCSTCRAENVIIGNVYHSYTYEDITTDTHTRACRNCDYTENPESHRGSCSEPDHCWDCNTDAVNLGTVYHNNTYKDITNETHTRGCTNCDYVERTEPHYGSCTDTDKCTRCGEDGVKLEYVGHNYTYKDITNESHTQGCTNCDYTGNKNAHYGSCVDPDKCTVCDADGVKLEFVFHSHIYENITTDTHTLGCSKCDYTQSPEPHSGSCTDPNKCWNCNTDGVTLQYVSHNYTYKDITNETHTRGCTNCDYAENPKSHYGSCAEPNKCTQCGTNGVKLGSMYHNYTYKDIKKYTHTYACTNCDDTQLPSSHYGSCKDPDRCIYCGAEGIKVEELYHDYTYKNITTDTHTPICSNCEHTLNPEKHYGSCVAPNKCTACEAKGVNLGSVGHHITYKDITNETHTRGCNYCDYTEKPESHYAFCTNTDVCVMCGTSDVTNAKIIHTGGCAECQ